MVKKNILSKKTRFQRVDIIDNYEFGRVVILDDKIQSAEADEFVYHEALVHPAMITHPNPESVLVLGGGEGRRLENLSCYAAETHERLFNLPKCVRKNLPDA